MTFADDWRALLIGTPNADMEAVADAFDAWGIERVYREEEPPFTAFMDDANASGGALVYISGGTELDQSSLAPFLARLTENETLRVAVLIENCSGETPSVSDFDFSNSVSLFVASSVAAGESCEALPRRLTDQLLALGDGEDGEIELQSALAEFASVSTAEGPWILGARTPANVSIVTDEVVVLTPVQPAQSAEPVRANPTNYARASGGVLILDAGNEAQIQPIPVRAGLPQPYIRVGLIEPTPAAFTTAPASIEVTATEITLDDVIERRRLRQEAPELFRDLLGTGAFDPPEGELVYALQTELARMRCYDAGVDGQWGGGSRRGVVRFFDEVDGVDPVSLEPGVPLYRQILELDEVECPPEAPVAQAPAAAAPARAAPARAAPARAAPPRATPARTTPTQTSRPRQTAQPAAPRPRQTAPAAPARKTQTNPTIRLGTGVFR